MGALTPSLNILRKRPRKSGVPFCPSHRAHPAGAVAPVHATITPLGKRLNVPWDVNAPVTVVVPIVALFNVALFIVAFETVKLSLFAFYSPDEEDFFITPEASINVTDNMLLALGTNIFAGAKDNTTFGQQHKNSNIYVLTRYSF